MQLKNAFKETVTSLRRLTETISAGRSTLNSQLSCSDVISSFFLARSGMILYSLCHCQVVSLRNGRCYDSRNGYQDDIHMNKGSKYKSKEPEQEMVLLILYKYEV